jgi:anti-sigma regulatory factor (Ser/Thr protein kinase)
MSTPSHQAIAIPVSDGSAVGHARRTAVALAEKVGLNETRRGELALIVTEAGTNLLQHAGGGELLLRPLASSQGGLEVLALDRGPGMADVALCLRDGYSTGGSRGAGLGSIMRLADCFDIHSQPGRGTALLARCCVTSRRPETPARSELGALCVAYPGEEVTGDGWREEERDGCTFLLVVDGLGHGPQATEPSLAALRRFDEHWNKQPVSMLQAIHGALRGTRGAAGAAVVVDWNERMVHFAGVGNIAGSLFSDAGSRGLSSHNGILGEGQPRLQEFTYPWPEDGMLVVHSDGISQRWSFDGLPGLPRKDTSLIAGVLYRDFSRRDDSTVLVLREAKPSEPSESAREPAP